MQELIQRDKAKAELKVALDSQDADLIMEAQDKLDKISCRKRKSFNDSC